MFKDETGIPSQPPYSSLSKIISNLVPDTSLPYPLNNTWGYHDACSGNGHYETYYKAMKDRYGAPISMKDFCDKMQLVNADGYRAIFEAAAHRLNETGGVMLWKLNAAFPSVAWQVYDWYLQPNSGYYFMQRACEPLHVQLNLDDSMVAVVNRSYQPQSNLTVVVDVLDINGKSRFHQTASINSKATSAREILSVASSLAKEGGVVFVVLHLKDVDGKLISQNVYWMDPKHDYTPLSQMKRAEIQVKLVGLSKGKGIYTYQLQFNNSSDQLAFFINPQLTLDGEELRPCFWDRNYFSLLPHESIAIGVSCPVGKIGDMQPMLVTSGWNVSAHEMILK